MSNYLRINIPPNLNPSGEFSVAVSTDGSSKFDVTYGFELQTGSPHSPASERIFKMTLDEKKFEYSCKILHGTGHNFILRFKEGTGFALGTSTPHWVTVTPFVGGDFDSSDLMGDSRIP